MPEAFSISTENSLKMGQEQSQDMPSVVSIRGENIVKMCRV